MFDDVEVLDFAGPFEVFAVAAEIVMSVCSGALVLATVGLLGEAAAERTAACMEYRGG